jgi:glycosyltransferase-like protein
MNARHDMSIDNTRPLRIGLLMHSLNPRGGVVHAMELADALVARGHAVTLFAAARLGQTLFRQTAAALSIAPLNTPQANPPDTTEAHSTDAMETMVATRLAALTSHLRHHPDIDRFDILHSQDGITANALATLLEEGRIPAFLRTVHHLDTFASPRLMAWQVRGVRSAAEVMCVSTLWQDVLRRDWGLNAQRVGNGVNLQRFVPQVDAARAIADAALCAHLGVQADGPVWLSVGGIEERKNTARLLQAFALARQQRPDAQLVIAGGASLLDHEAEAQAFLAACQANGLAPGQPDAHRVLITGPLPDEALPALYRRAAAVAMPSLSEGFGLVVLEALACGSPAIASRIAPFTEHLSEHDVLWTDPHSPEDIAQALLRSLNLEYTAPVLARSQATCARHTWAASAARHEAIYRSHLLHRSQAAASTPTIAHLTNCHA